MVNNLYLATIMAELINLTEETLSHFQEGARSVKAYAEDATYIITRARDSEDFWVTIEEPGFPKTKTSSLEQYFESVYGIEALY